jgi:hypothetical protein
MGLGAKEAVVGEEEWENDIHLGLADSLAGAKSAIHGHWRTEIRRSVHRDLASGRAIREGRSMTDLRGIRGLGGWLLVVDQQNQTIDK